mmetsp:Transcript_47857/g.54225  ORF Transcript_47857/g.54225 Transcript_47857/m.54225 type:complete len:133 (+) Transcript_47857:111-509(+)
MKTSIVVLSTLLVGAQSFAPVTTVTRGQALFAAIPVEDMSESQLEIKKIQDKWNEIRFLDRDEAQKSLDGEWLEAFNKFHEQYDSDMERMEEIVNKLEKQINPPKVEKKTKGQRRRDAYAAKLERAGHAYNQ